MKYQCCPVVVSSRFECRPKGDQLNLDLLLHERMIMFYVSYSSIVSICQAYDVVLMRCVGLRNWILRYCIEK